MAAATAKRTNVSQPGGSQCKASLDSGTVVPQSSPAPISAAKVRRFVFMRPWSLPHAQNLASEAL
jgi:hypothetical protein